MAQHGLRSPESANLKTMASYENPSVRDDVNVAPHSAVGEFAKLSIALAASVVLLVVALTWGFRWLAPWIPFSYEQRIAAPIVEQLTKDRGTSPAQSYLQHLAEQLAAHMDFPKGMSVQVHWSDSTVPNAFATLGGHITIYQGLIHSVQTENGLAMVLAHELAHVRHRDPLVSAGSGLILASSLGAVLGSGAESIVGKTSAALMQLQFSRQQERAADAVALRALHAYYGHASGADEFFSTMQQAGKTWAAHNAATFLQTHPGTEQRIADIRAFVAATAVKDEVQLTPLPDFLRTPTAK
ncbi:M48 family metallopeptidase [Lampropedia puyangensis]|uniref:M48 family metallopeptidase n=1 Tax=Lampropedia puyangensis TaxID=1330072 RepID=A0A4S8FDA1_9BURK|nr:M48 family metallopeptidase [Lampropedia puyangensis]THU05279.1 M48 family metallopeptidase [Lampropedia puyangensis]